MDYSGMTVNERLFVSGLLKDFELAKKQNDVIRIIDILRKIDVDEESIGEILKTLKLDRPK